MDKITIKKIRYEILQIEKLLDEAQPLLSSPISNEPSFSDKCGYAIILHSFYNGIEKMLLFLIKNTDYMFISPDRWHSELLSMAFKIRDNDKSIFRDATND